MGGVHGKGYRLMPDVELFAFDRNPERLNIYCRENAAAAVSSREDLIAKCDVIDVCLPTDVHLEAALETIAAGKALFCEKPLARSLKEAEQMLTAANTSGVPFGVGQVVRYFPEFRRAHDLVKTGAVGKPAAIRTHRGGTAPSGADGWFMDMSRSGGVLVDLAIHDFDWLRWTFGEVKSLYARSTAIAKGGGPEYALTVLTMESGAIAHVESTWMDPRGFSTAFEIAGSDGLLNYDSREAASLQVATAGKIGYEANLVPTDDPYYQELRAFIDAVKAGSEPPVGGEEGFHALAISIAAFESAQKGTPMAPARL
jgi:predicted dehydrogenase